MATHEHLTHEPNNEEAWICVCGNTPTADGFYPCDKDGKEVTPTPDAWTTGCYVCARCGRIIDHNSLDVLGRKSVQPEAHRP